MEIPRPQIVRRIENGLLNSPITALLGPRQAGKTWLARLENTNYGVLDDLQGTVVIDEAQEKPDLFQKLPKLTWC